MVKKKKPYSDRRFWEPLGLRKDGTSSAVTRGTKKYSNEEDMQRDIETSKKIIEHFSRNRKDSST